MRPRSVCDRAAWCRRGPDQSFACVHSLVYVSRPRDRDFQRLPFGHVRVVWGYWGQVGTRLLHSLVHSAWFWVGCQKASRSVGIRLRGPCTGTLGQYKDRGTPYRQCCREARIPSMCLKLLLLQLFVVHSLLSLASPNLMPVASSLRSHINLRASGGARSSSLSCGNTMAAPLNLRGPKN